MRIPKSFAHEVGLEQDSPVEVSLEDGRLVIEAVPKSKLTLRRLLAQVTKDNRHAKLRFRLVCKGCRMDMYLTKSSSGRGRGIAETWHVAIMIKTCDKSNSFEEIKKLLAM